MLCILFLYEDSLNAAFIIFHLKERLLSCYYSCYYSLIVPIQKKIIVPIVVFLVLEISTLVPFFFVYEFYFYFLFLYLYGVVCSLCQPRILVVDFCFIYLFFGGGGMMVV